VVVAAAAVVVRAAADGVVGPVAAVTGAVVVTGLVTSGIVGPVPGLRGARGAEGENTGESESGDAASIDHGPMVTRVTSRFVGDIGPRTDCCRRLRVARTG
jgi:hypothetical protein